VQGQGTTSSSAHPANPRPGNRVAERNGGGRGRRSQQLMSLKQCVTNCAKGTFAQLSRAAKNNPIQGNVVFRANCLRKKLEKKKGKPYLISRCSTTIISISVEMMNPCDEKASVTEKQLSGVMFHKVRVTRTRGPSARELNSQQLSTILGFKMCRGKQVLRLV